MNNFIRIAVVTPMLMLAMPVAYATQAHLIPSAFPSSVPVGISQTIRWQSSNFPSDGKVDVNLVQQVSASPRAFALVRQIAKGVANTGTFAWMPAKSDAGTNMYMQITCSSATAFKKGCVSEEPTVRFAVVAAPPTIAQGNLGETASTLNTLATLRDALRAILQLLQVRQ